MGSVTPQPEDQPLDPDLPSAELAGAGSSGAVLPGDQVRPPVRWESTRLLLLLIFVGAALGTSMRDVIERAFPTPPGGWPWATFGINLVGSLVLGALLQTLARTGDDVGWRRAARLGCGTGVLGGFTTYSTFVLEIDTLADAGFTMRGAAYGLMSVLLGLVAAGAGIWLADRPDWSRGTIGEST